MGEVIKFPERIAARAAQVAAITDGLVPMVEGVECIKCSGPLEDHGTTGYCPACDAATKKPGGTPA